MKTLEEIEEGGRAIIFRRRDRLRRIDDKLAEQIEGLIDSGTLTPDQLLAAKKATGTELYNLEVGLAELGSKAPKKIETHQHLTIFAYTPEQWNALPPVEREVIEKLRIRAEAEVKK